MYDQLLQEYQNTHSLVSQHALADWCEEVGEPRSEEWRLRAWLHEKFIYMASEPSAHYWGPLPGTRFWISFDRDPHFADGGAGRGGQDVICMSLGIRRGDVRYMDVRIQYLGLNSMRLIEAPVGSLPEMYGSEPSLYPPWKNAEAAYLYIARVRQIDRRGGRLDY